MNYILNFNELFLSKTVSDYYQTTFDFKHISYSDENIVIPILNFVNEALKNYDVLMDRYSVSFIDAYNKVNFPIPQSDEDKIWLLRKIMPMKISFQNGSIPYFEEGLPAIPIQEVAKWTAECFRAWELIINDLPYYETAAFFENNEVSDLNSQKIELFKGVSLKMTLRPSDYRKAGITEFKEWVESDFYLWENSLRSLTVDLKNEAIKDAERSLKHLYNKAIKESDVYTSEKLELIESYKPKIQNAIHIGEIESNRLIPMPVFDSLFQMAIKLGVIEQPNNKAQFEAMKTLYESQFQSWYLKNGGLLEVGNSVYYDKFMTESNWLEFLKFEKNKKESEIKTKEAERLKWLAIINGTNKPQVFKTTLSEDQRKKICDEIFENAKSKRVADVNNRVFIDITEAHRPTLNYLLGGERPKEIVQIKMKSHQKVYEFLEQYSDYYFKDKKCLPKKLIRKEFLPEILLDSDGKKITILNNKS